MSEMYTMTRKDFKKLEQFFAQAPRKFTLAAKNVLNSFAFGVKDETFNQINKTMTVRNSRFIKSTIQVVKAKGSSLNNISSQAGIIRKTGFSGFIEQEIGKTTQLKRTITKFARGDNWGNKVRAKNRMKPSNNFFNPDKFSGRSYEHRVAKMLGSMRKGHAIKKRSFIINKKMSGRLSTMKRGAYSWQAKLAKRVQNFEKKTQPKKNPIVSNARRNYFNRVSIINIWSASIRRVIKFK